MEDIFLWMIDELCHTFFPSFWDPTYIIVKLFNLVDKTTSHLSSSGPHIFVDYQIKIPSHHEWSTLFFNEQWFFLNPFHIWDPSRNPKRCFAYGPRAVTMKIYRPLKTIQRPYHGKYNSNFTNLWVFKLSIKCMWTTVCWGIATYFMANPFDVVGNPRPWHGNIIYI